MSTLLDSISQLAGDVKRGMTYTDSVKGTSSLSKITKSARVEPICIVSRDVMNLDYMPKLVSGALNIFINQYVQAISLMTEVGGIRVAKTLDSLNPDRSFSTLIAGLESVEDTQICDNLYQYSLESYEYRLPSTLNKPAMEDGLAYYKKVKEKAVKAAKTAAVFEEGLKDSIKRDNEKATHSANSSSSKLKDVYNSGDLMVGKVVDVTLKSGEDTFTLPIQFNLTGVPLPENTVKSMLTATSNDRNISDIWRGWRSGRLNFWKDIVLSDQLVKEHRKALMSDDTGTYKEIMTRARRNSAVGIASGKPSLATASNIYIISSETAEDIEFHLGGRLDGPHGYKNRQKLFDASHAGLIIVVNRQRERVILHHNGMNNSANLSVKEITDTGKKSSGDDIGDLLKGMLTAKSFM